VDARSADGVVVKMPAKRSFSPLARLTSFYKNGFGARDYNLSVMVRAKSSVVLVGLLLILLPFLAVWQYSWIGEVSNAELDRLQSSLRAASDRFATDFDAEFTRLSNSYQIRDGFPESGTPIVARHQAWTEAAQYPRIVRSVGLLKTLPGTQTGFYKVDLHSGELQAATVPLELLNIRDRFRTGAGSLSSPERPDTMMLVTTIFRPGRQFGPGGPRPNDFRGPGPPPGNSNEGAVVIELDRDAILKDLVPALVERNFSSHDDTAYRVAVATEGDHPRVLYSSEGEWKPEDIKMPDALVPLFGNPPPPAGGNGGGGSTRRGNRARGPGLRGGLQTSLISQPWQLVVKHRAGSLERAVEQVRERDLAISFGILLVLGAGLIAVVISSQRAHTLGKLQMEFAAGVSHELRTPLAVIRSAAYNLRSGVVHDKEGIEQYAAIVQDEARRLSDMVEEVLLYSETQSGRKKYSLEPIDVNEVIERAITNLSPAIDVEKCEFTTRIDPDLPPVKADLPALTQCVQNLLSNALKYGKSGEKAQIEIAGQKDTGSRDVRLSVTDHGPGVDTVDQRHLFEPFYRGSRVGSNVPGNGLGLHLVKSIMQAQGGRVTFTPAPHGGACFTLHIPAAS
jgi:signal transduction histidine kinase